MRLIKCYIESFGMFSNKSFDFKEGLNCIYSKNSTGKTTLSVFISAMLYGFPDTRSKSLEENERKKYAPWQGGTYGGSLTLEAGGVTYTVERTFGQKPSDDTFTLRNTDTGSISSDYGPNIGGELFGIDRDGFLRTVFLSEKNLSVKNDNRTISAKLSNLVGVDGDVGGFDKAIDLLDDRRRFYYKKSGSCEINTLKARIAERTLELDRLMKIEERAEESKKLLAELGEKKKELEDKKRELGARVLSDAKSRERLAHLDSYRAAKAKLCEDKKRRCEIEAVLGDDIPSISSVNEARFALIEGERIIKDCSSDIGEDFGELYSRYSEIDMEVISNAERAADDLSDTKTRIRAIEDGSDPACVRMSTMFPSGAPTDEEIDGYIEATRKRGASGVISLICGILALISGGVLGYLIAPLLFSITALGAVLFITGAVIMKKSSKRGDTSPLLKRLRREGARLTDLEIESIKRQTVIYAELEKSRDEMLASLTKRREDIEALLGELVTSIGLTSSADLIKDVRAIREEYTKYYMMSVSARQNAEGQKERMATAEAMIKRSRDFISRYNLTSDKPFDELSNLITEYGYIKRSIDEQMSECANMEVRYGLTESMLESAPVSADSTAESELEACENALASAVHEYAVTESEHERQMRECEEIESVTSEIDSLKAKLEEYTKSLGIIQSTITLLKEACESMTSRYIGKTREGFLKYENAIGGDGGSYAVAVDFSVTKNEHGAAREEESYSRGTKDLHALAVRLALIDALYENESPFVILDDPFIALDDDKVEKGRKLLSNLAKERQILYFTCSKSRAV